MRPCLGNPLSRHTNCLLRTFRRRQPALQYVFAQRIEQRAYQYEDAVNTIVYENILACHGTIAAEHGVGIIKKHWLPRVRTQAELILMHAIKNQLDPYGIMNPDKLLPSLD